MATNSIQKIMKSVMEERYERSRLRRERAAT
jgi:hypothetical protein